MRKLKLYEAHYADAKMESDMKDIFIEIYFKEKVI